MKKALLVVVLIGARALGLFALARWMTRSDLRILAYHGAALGDESRFSPGLFMSEATFAQRMAFLADRGYRVIGLDHALGALSRGDLPDFATVITMDDGWYGTCRLMSPILKRHGFPATFYVSTYYVEKQTQVFNVAVGYVLWKAAGTGRLDLSTLSSGLVGAIDLSEPRQRQAALDAIVEHAESLGDAGARQDLLRRLCEVLDVDWGAILEKRMFAFASGEALRSLPAMGVDVQLHSHRHRFPADDMQAASDEIDDNRRVLTEFLRGPFEHFCYPSGVYEPAQFACLSAKGISSATTTEAGFARSTSHRFALPRLLDSERITPLEFEAEMSGFLELLRRIGVPGLIGGSPRSGTDRTAARASTASSTARTPPDG
jgi:peptidoglycan/xylan/chitin deacetylase (PgdA/CDA1 family)